MTFAKRSLLLYAWITLAAAVMLRQTTAGPIPEDGPVTMNPITDGPDVPHAKRENAPANNDNVADNNVAVFEVAGFEATGGDRALLASTITTTADCLRLVQQHGHPLGSLVTGGPNAGQCFGFPADGAATIVITRDSSTVLLAAAAANAKGTATTLPDVDLEGQDLQDPGVYEVDEGTTCLRLCTVHPRCNAATHNRFLDQCWLKEKTTTHPVNPDPCTPSTGLCHPATSYYFPSAPQGATQVAEGTTSTAASEAA